jgi:hypothetical protein
LSDTPPSAASELSAARDTVTWLEELVGALEKNTRRADRALKKRRLAPAGTVDWEAADWAWDRLRAELFSAVAIPYQHDVSRRVDSARRAIDNAVGIKASRDDALELRMRLRQAEQAYRSTRLTLTRLLDTP